MQALHPNHLTSVQYPSANIVRDEHTVSTSDHQSTLTLQNGMTKEVAAGVFLAAWRGAEGENWPKRFTITWILYSS